ncbi:MAG: DegT/DnrJ/EryC1/StrS family aminotransferase [Thermoanaerobaculia bacterium]
MSSGSRIVLSPPFQAGGELDLLKETLESNWIAPLGPQVDAFEREFAEVVGIGHAAALASGTAALHLGLRLLGVEPGDQVLCSDLTFVASANAVRYLGAEPVFLDSDRKSWNLDPNLLEEELSEAASQGALPKALIAVDIYGQSADWNPIQEICGRFEVPILEDAAEALGATYHGVPVGRFGRLAIFSFNGNKIITTSGGGMLVSDDSEIVEKTRFLASQARDPEPHYEHSELGYNYRLSNLLAAVGRVQLETLEERVRRRRANFAAYRDALGALPGLSFMPEASYGRSTRWLTCLTIDSETFGSTPAEIREALEAGNIECRPLWKPMHLQPLYRGCRTRGGQVAQQLFASGLCLPSGTALTATDLARVAGIVERCHRT